jgi:membrane protein
MGAVFAPMSKETKPDPKGHRASSPWQMPRPAWKDIAARTYQRTWDDNIGLVASGVAFYGFFALLSVLGTIVFLYGLFAEPRTVIGHMQTLTAILPASVAALIGEQLMNAVQSSGSTKGFGILVGFGVALYGGTNGAAAILTALNIAYEEKEKRSLLRFYLISMAMAVVAIALALGAIAMAAAVAYLQAQVPTEPGFAALAGDIVGYVVLTLVAVPVRSFPGGRPLEVDHARLLVRSAHLAAAEQPVRALSHKAHRL